MTYIVRISVLNLPSRRCRAGDIVTAEDFVDLARFEQALSKRYLTAAEDAPAPKKAKAAATKPAKPDQGAEVKAKPPAPKKAKAAEVRVELINELKLGLWPGELNDAEKAQVLETEWDLDLDALANVPFEELVKRVLDWGGEVGEGVTEKKDVVEALAEQVGAWRAVLAEG